MTQREKILAVGLIVVIGGGLGGKAVKSLVIEPRRQLVKDIQKQRERRERLEVRLSGIDRIVEGWQAQTEQTLDLESFRAGQIFRRDVDELLKRNKLIAAKSSIGEPQVDEERKFPREGFVELSLSVSTQGTLADLVSFLKDFYQRPYLVRVDKLSMTAQRTRKPSSRRRTGPRPEPQLKITMTLKTLVLPKVKEVEHPTIDLAAFDDPEREVEYVAAPRLHEEDLEAYNRIVQVNPFVPYEPPPAQPPPPTEPEKPPVAVKTAPEPTPRPTPNPRRDAHKYVVSGTARLDDGPIAYVTNKDNLAQPPDEYRLNDEIDGGKLVLIVPQGIVVRVPAPKTGRREPPKNYFYALGTSFAERVEVNPADHKEIALLLRQVLKP